MPGLTVAVMVTVTLPLTGMAPFQVTVFVPTVAVAVPAVAVAVTRVRPAVGSTSNSSLPVLSACAAVPELVMVMV